MTDSAKWKFDVVDVNGTPLTEGGLNLATDIAMLFQLIKPDTFSCKLPLTSPEAQRICTQIDNNSDLYIKGYRTPFGSTTAALLFYGTLMVDEVIGQNGFDMLGVTAIEPLEILDQRYSTLNYTSSDLGTTLAAMINSTNSTDGETGIRTNAGHIVASATQSLDTRSTKPSISSVADQFAAQDNGVEVWTVPIELAAGKICDFYAAPQKGAATTVVFAYGNGTEVNCSAMGRVRDKKKSANTQNGSGDGVLASVKTDATSIASIRNRIEYTSFTGETSQANLDLRTQGRINKSSTVPKTAEHTCTPTAAAPRLFDDYQIGDTVYLHFKKGIEWGVNQRVVSVGLQVSNNGVERPNGIALRT